MRNGKMEIIRTDIKRLSMQPVFKADIGVFYSETSDYLTSYKQLAEQAAQPVSGIFFC